MTTPTTNNDNLTTSTSTVDSWTKWFASRDSSDFINKQAQEELFKAFNATIDSTDCKKKLIDHQEVAFLFKKLLGTNSMCFITSLKLVAPCMTTTSKLVLFKVWISIPPHK